MTVNAIVADAQRRLLAAWTPNRISPRVSSAGRRRRRPDPLRDDVPDRGNRYRLEGRRPRGVAPEPAATRGPSWRTLRSSPCRGRRRSTRHSHPPPPHRVDRDDPGDGMMLTGGSHAPLENGCQRSRRRRRGVSMRLISRSNGRSGPTASSDSCWLSSVCPSLPMRVYTTTHVPAPEPRCEHPWRVELIHLRPHRHRQARTHAYHLTPPGSHHGRSRWRLLHHLDGGTGPGRPILDVGEHGNDVICGPRDADFSGPQQPCRGRSNR